MIFVSLLANFSDTCNVCVFGYVMFAFHGTQNLSLKYGFADHIYYLV